MAKKILNVGNKQRKMHLLKTMFLHLLTSTIRLSIEFRECIKLNGEGFKIEILTQNKTKYGAEFWCGWSFTWL